ncbi:hypothetical protein AVEN_36442-1 [Araneus ventricosus]|uniref:Uncharacterized protein n=1 Tax=Araneus ventricosus TaxID=182803 RepID=A0A4Y2J9R5_ARAVE|nr:hypothetical protein AVEN_36442-1 [Araneus ventricosus]
MTRTTPELESPSPNLARLRLGHTRFAHRQLLMVEVQVTLHPFAHLHDTPERRAGGSGSLWLMTENNPCLVSFQSQSKGLLENPLQS